MMAKTLYGFEPILAKELRNLGAGHVEEGVRNVTFEGDIGFMYKANLCLRTALKVFKPIKTFRVFNEKDLYRNIYELDWPEFFDVEFGSQNKKTTITLNSYWLLVEHFCCP